MMVLLLLFVLSGLLGNVHGKWFDCRRPWHRCKQDRICRYDGTCDCLGDAFSDDCEFSSPGHYNGSELCTEDLKCSVGSVCFNSSMTHVGEGCACQDGFFGQTCQQQRAAIKCWGDRVAVVVNPVNFRGKIYPLESVLGNVTNDKCYLRPVTRQPDDPNMAFFSTGFGHTRQFINDPSPCFDDAVQLQESDTAVYQMKYLIQYNENFMSYYDEILTVECHVSMFPTDALKLYFYVNPLPMSWLLHKDVLEQSLDNFNMAVSYENGTLVGSSDLIPIGSSLVVNISLTDNTSLVDLNVDSCDIRRASDNDQDAVVFYEDGCVVPRYGLETGDFNASKDFWIKFSVPRFHESPNIVLSCAVTGCTAEVSVCKKSCTLKRKRREQHPANTSETSQQKQRLTLLLVIDSDLPSIATPGADENVSDREPAALIISLCIGLIASVFSIVICLAMCVWSKWRNAGSKGTIPFTM